MNSPTTRFCVRRSDRGVSDTGLALRRRLIREGRARVARLTAADLQQADALYMGNGLRGLVRVSLTTAWA